MRRNYKIVTRLTKVGWAYLLTMPLWLLVVTVTIYHPSFAKDYSALSFLTTVGWFVTAFGCHLADLLFAYDVETY